MTLNDELSPKGMMALVWSFTAFSVLLTIGRQALRFTTTSRFRLEDLFHGIAQALLIGFATTFTVWLRYDQKAHSKVNTLGGTATKNVPDPHVMIHFSVAIVTQFWSIMNFVKFTFLVLYRSIFKISQGFMKAWWIVLVFTAIAYLMTFMSTFWVCGSPQNAFNVAQCRAHKAGGSTIRVVLMGTALNVATDFAVMALPLCMLRTIQMPKKQKAGLAAVFLLGLVDLSFDIIRIWHTVHVAGRGGWAVWDILEPCIAVIASALPPYKILLSDSQTRKLSGPKPSQHLSDNSESTGSQSSGASDSTKGESPDPYGKFLDIEECGFVTTVRPILNPSPLASTFGEFRESKIKLNEYNEV